METKEVMLTLCLVTYNHEKYIKECLDHIFRQKVNFKMEILVGNDCSTDATAKIIENNYGDKVTLINRKENMGLCHNMYDLFMRARGKYVYLFSGDDYFLDEEMLQKQVDFLETHSDYFSVTSRFRLYHQEENRYADCDVKWGDYSIVDFLSGEKMLYLYGTMRNIFVSDCDNNGFLKDGARNNEEIKMWVYTLDKGKKYIYKDYMTVYRFVSKEGSSNYCSVKNMIDVFKDYYTDLKLVESFFGSKYRFRPYRLTLLNKYCVMMSDSLGSLMQFFNVINGIELLELLWYKVYLKFHDYRMPLKWKEQNYILK